MSFSYYVSVTLHVLAAIVWLGGMFFIALVGGPVLRAVEPQVRARLFRDLGLRFRTVGWVALTILVVTGLANLALRDLLQWSVLLSGDFWATPYGRVLGVKLGAVLVMLVLSGLHDFVIGPAAARLEAGSEAAAAVRVRASRLARVNAVVGLVLVVAAVRLARGG